MIRQETEEGRNKDEEEAPSHARQRDEGGTNRRFHPPVHIVQKDRRGQSPEEGGAKDQGEEKGTEGETQGDPKEPGKEEEVPDLPRKRVRPSRPQGAGQLKEREEEPEERERNPPDPVGQKGGPEGCQLAGVGQRDSEHSSSQLRPLQGLLADCPQVLPGLRTDPPLPGGLSEQKGQGDQEKEDHQVYDQRQTERNRSQIPSQECRDQNPHSGAEEGPSLPTGVFTLPALLLKGIVEKGGIASRPQALADPYHRFGEGESSKPPTPEVEENP